MSMIEGYPPIEVLRMLLAELDEGQIPESVDDVPPPLPSQSPEEAFRNYLQCARNLVAGYAEMLGVYRWARQQKGFELTFPLSASDFAEELAQCVGGDDPDMLCNKIADRICKLVPSHA